MYDLTMSNNVLIDYVRAILYVNKMLNVCIYMASSACLYTLVSPPVAPRRIASLYSGVGIMSAPRQHSKDGIDRRRLEKLLSLLSLDPVYRNL